ncbi:MAG: glycine cleavage system protein GcvH, partial [Dolichospermum sp.]
HEYVRLDDDIATIGITQFAIEQLGDIVFLELPDIGDAIIKGDTFGTIESVKAVETLNSPVSGTVIESNEALLNNPEQVADDPYGEGWFIKVRVDDAAEIDDSLTAEQYEVLVEGM